MIPAVNDHGKPDTFGRLGGGRARITRLLHRRTMGGQGRGGHRVDRLGEFSVAAQPGVEHTGWGCTRVAPAVVVALEYGRPLVVKPASESSRCQPVRALSYVRPLDAALVGRGESVVSLPESSSDLGRGVSQLLARIPEDRQVCCRGD